MCPRVMAPLVRCQVHRLAVLVTDVADRQPAQQRHAVSGAGDGVVPSMFLVGRGNSPAWPAGQRCAMLVPAAHQDDRTRHGRPATASGPNQAGLVNTEAPGSVVGRRRHLCLDAARILL